MNGKDLRFSIEHIQNAKALLYADIYEDDLDNFSCYEGRGEVPDFDGDNPYFNLFDYKEKLSKAYIINNLDAILSYIKGYSEEIETCINNEIDALLKSGTNAYPDIIETLIDKLEKWINGMNIQAPAINTEKIKISYEIPANDRLIRTIKDVAEETGYLYSGEQLSDAVSSIAENILDRYLDTEYLDTDIIQDIIQDYFVKQ